MANKSTDNPALIQTRRKVRLTISPWIFRTYAVLAIVLLPWTVYLGESLPSRYLSRHWDASWAGLDSALILAFIVTAVLAYKRSRWVTVTTTMVGTLLLVDAWFDILSAKAGSQLNEALFFAIFGEIPLAIISFAIAAHVLTRNID